MIASGKFEIRGDAVNTVAAIIQAADAAKPPLRLALGSTAYENIHRVLNQRLDSLEAQRDVAFSADSQER